MESMTGYGEARLETSFLSAFVQIKSVNGRGLEPKFFLPAQIYKLEPQLRSLLKKEFERGSFDVVFSYADLDFSKVIPKLKSWVQSYKRVSENLEVQDGLTLEWVLEQSKKQGVQTLSVTQEKQLLELFCKAVIKLKKQRIQEGRALKKVISQELKVALRVLVQIKSHTRKFQKGLKVKWERRVEELKLNLDPGRLESEVALILEKADTTEEIKRLEAHIKEVQSLLKSQTGAVGKKLDFFCQELYREVNTLSSKAKDVNLTRLSVELKSSFEKIRQQVQNIQ